MSQLRCVFIGLSITSAWGNGHATTYRALLKALHARGHRITFLERDVPWYADNREFDSTAYCDVVLYASVAELKERFADLVRTADVVVVGSYVPDGIEAGEWVNSTARGCRAFYDIDTPITLSALRDGTCQYLSAGLAPKYDLYLSFSGGPILKVLEDEFLVQSAKPLYCSVDPDLYFPEDRAMEWDLGYLGTYAADRQPLVEELVNEPARRIPGKRFAVAGPQYPREVQWPENVTRIEHLPPAEHRGFYNSQRFTLNLTRRDMVAAGYSPSVRLFEASACGTPILSDEWAGLDTFFVPGREIITVKTREDVGKCLGMSEAERLEIGRKARERTLQFHTSAVRAREFEEMVRSAGRLSGEAEMQFLAGANSI